MVWSPLHNPGLTTQHLETEQVKIMGYLDINDEQYKKLPDGFVLYACEICECSLFAIDQNSLEGDTWPHKPFQVSEHAAVSERTAVCCLGCGHVMVI